MTSFREEILNYARDFYGTVPDCPWQSDPGYTVLRHSKTKKWYGLIMDIPKRKLGDFKDETVDILNVKCDPVLIGSLTLKEGCFPAYHMSKEHWLTVLLDGSVALEEIIGLLNMSYELTSENIRK